MAREFNDSTSNYLKVSTPAISTGPCTLFCWAKRDTTDDAEALITVTETGAGPGLLKLEATVSNLLFASHAQDGGSGSSALNTGFTSGSWHACCGVFHSTTSRYAWVDGSAGSQDTNSRTWPTGLAATLVGATETASIGDPFDGQIAEVGIWDVALTDAEVVSLSAGMCPMMVRPQSLVAYWPLHAGSGAGNEFDWVGGLTLTETGTVTAAEHPPRIIYPHDQVGAIRIPWFFEPDWVGENPMREFSSVPKAENPPRLVYPQTNVEPVTPSTFQIYEDWVGNFPLRKRGSVLKKPHP